MLRAWAAADGALFWDAITFSDAGPGSASAAADDADELQEDFVDLASSRLRASAARASSRARRRGARPPAPSSLANTAAHVGRARVQWFPSPRTCSTPLTKLQPLSAEAEATPVPRSLSAVSENPRYRDDRVQTACTNFLQLPRKARRAGLP